MRKLLLAALVAASTLFGPKVFADPIVLYASASVDEISTVVEGFKEQHPNIAVSVVHDGTGSLMRRMKAEASNPQADVFWSGGLSTLAAFKENFEPYKSSEAANYPRETIGEQDLWLGTTTLGHVFLVNTQALKGRARPFRPRAVELWGGDRRSS